MFAGDNDSIYDPRGSVYALDLSTGGNSSSRLSSYPTPPASLRLAQRQAQQHTRSQQADQALADERLKSDLPLSDPRHPANNPLHPSLSTKRKQRILHSTPNNATNGTQPASQTARRESSASTLGASDEEERLAQERMQRERR
ncbi:hypothetical protein BT69DRAFT_741299 [Atractiella rhizophila]|nr:hypothetical protein BT69DRAFT_741299 [Atractiella rhizophila]